jgi:D-3-phosphoglycerate dehydrogenase
MKILCWGREPSLAKARAAGYEVAAGRTEFFASVDVLSLNLRYNAETHGVITAADFARMKPSAHFVNTSRALLVEEGALAEALRKGRPGYAAVDVYEDEPVLGGDHPLLALPNCVCTPHLGGTVRERYELRYNFAVDSVLGFAAGRPVHVVNPEVLGRR